MSTSTTAIGRRLIQKTARHEARSTRMPPKSGPMRNALVVHAVQRPIARPCSALDDAEPAERVGERAGEQDERPERQQVGVDRPLLQREAAAELGRDRRERHVDDRAVEERDERDDDGDDEHPCATVHPPMLAQSTDARAIR